MLNQARALRDVFIEQICMRMQKDKNIFFICADFGSPSLDNLKNKFKNRFINVGIAEQNLVNISTGLALEGFTVYAYAIAPFLTMRAYEQIRINLSLHTHFKKELNVNLIGVGTGLSYDVSGPTHHCFEDTTIMRALPDVMVFSPSDWVLAERFVDYTIRIKKPKYLRFDGKPVKRIYADVSDADIKRGFKEIRKGNNICLISTGYMTHKAINVSDMLLKEGLSIGVIDLFLIKPFNEKGFLTSLNKYNYVLSIEESFIEKGGIDSLVLTALNRSKKRTKFKAIGFKDAYLDDFGSREHLHRISGLDEAGIIRAIRKLK